MNYTIQTTNSYMYIAYSLVTKKRVWQPKGWGCATAHSVLTVNHNEVDEGNNLTDVGHSTTNVNGAK